jgi:hypothetical protein
MSSIILDKLRRASRSLSDAIDRLSGYSHGKALINSLLVDADSAQNHWYGFATIAGQRVGLHSPDSSINQAAWCREVPALVLRLIGNTESCSPRCIGTDSHGVL